MLLNDATDRHKEFERQHALELHHINVQQRQLCIDCQKPSAHIANNRAEVEGKNALVSVFTGPAKKLAGA